MRAQKVNEALKDILVPKSKQQIRKDIKSINDPQQILRFKVKEAPFMPEYADVKGTTMGAFNELYGRFVLKNGKLSNTTQSIAYTTVDKR